MNQVLKRFGVNEEDLVDADKVRYPKAIPGRVAHIDADFMAYQASAETSDELTGVKPRKTVKEMCERTERGLEHLMRLCAAETYLAHITPTGSDKGGRDDQAVTLPYQGNRKDRERPEFLDAVRHFIGESLPSMVHLDQEADDGMAQANYKARDDGTGELSVIVSKDKDLRMVPGLHWCFDREVVVCVGDSFGSIWIDTKKTAKIMKGWGTLFFWAQLLMGDTADNIKGLPAITYGSLWKLGKPPTTLAKLLKRLKAETKRPRIEALEFQIRLESEKLKPVGLVMAADLLAGCMNDKECYDLVRGLFLDLQKSPNFDYIHHQTQQPVTPTQAMFGDMQLLWMRRSKNKRDVLAWINEWRDPRPAAEMKKRIAGTGILSKKKKEAKP